MPQLSLYLNDETMRLLRSDVKNEQTSISKYVSQLITRNASSSWPQGYWTEVYGCLDDDSFTVPNELDAALDGALPSFSK